MIDSIAMGERIRQRREELHISRESFAEQLGVTTKFCCDIESGARGTSLTTLAKISNCLMISTDYILFGSANKTSEHIIIQVFAKCPESKKKTLLEIIHKIIKSYYD